MKTVDLSLIELIILDVDGTMTDGGVYIDDTGVESKKFSIKDGAGILLGEVIGLEFMILTGRKSISVEKRAQELKISKVYQGVENKGDFIQKYFEKFNLDKEKVAYIGDDLNDLQAMKKCSISVCPNDAAEEVKAYCQLVLKHNGGDGVVREFVEIVLKEKGQWDNAIERLFMK
jgi:3-deoxy-D-manno-octulosonate 8-phosphate phosphatase (KDO 8-P phosphatase)